jgi:hypothetical protein
MSGFGAHAASLGSGAVGAAGLTGNREQPFGVVYVGDRCLHVGAVAILSQFMAMCRPEHAP